ncbi:hypothetical protein CLF_107263 [Clonorchis sinensis]|uniref:ATP-binding cassette transporter n=1 Tax=Clonorchis sinensis TaxID=79923 RepID=G7YGG3_CLOSI|nr:hypothetical protein CLF_107263 [Clonorchis sinensis]
MCGNCIDEEGYNLQYSRSSQFIPRSLEAVHGCYILPEHNFARRIIKHQVEVDLRAGGKAWWTRKGKETEEAQKARNARRLFQLMHVIGRKNRSADENLVDLEYANIVLVFEDRKKMNVF